MLANPGFPLQSPADKLDRLIKMAFGPVFGRTLRATFDPRAAVAAVPWYLSGGIAAANCIAAYQPKGAASLAASYTNLANPGTYDAAPGTAPTWDSTNGWKFNQSNMYLDTGLTPTNNQTWSVIVRFTNASTGNNLYAGLILAYNDGGLYQGFGFASTWEDGATDKAIYFNGGNSKVAPNIAAGTLCIGGTKAYRDGVDEGITIAAAAGSFYSLYIGASHIQTGVKGGSYNSCYIQAAAIYNVTLLQAQVTALNTAINAL